MGLRALDVEGDLHCCDYITGRFNPTSSVESRTGGRTPDQVLSLYPVLKIQRTVIRHSARNTSVTPMLIGRLTSETP